MSTMPQEPTIVPGTSRPIPVDPQQNPLTDPHPEPPTDP